MLGGEFPFTLDAALDQAQLGYGSRSSLPANAAPLAAAVRFEATRVASVVEERLVAMWRICHGAWSPCGHHRAGSEILDAAFFYETINGSITCGGRGSRIRTGDLKYPKLPRYRAALYPDFRRVANMSAACGQGRRSGRSQPVADRAACPSARRATSGAGPSFPCYNEARPWRVR